MKTLKFDSYSEGWLEFILNCRSGKDLTDYDLVVGGAANDNVFNTVELLMKNWNRTSYTLLITLLACFL